MKKTLLFAWAMLLIIGTQAQTTLRASKLEKASRETQSISTADLNLVSSSAYGHSLNTEIRTDNGEITGGDSHQSTYVPTRSVSFSDDFDGTPATDTLLSNFTVINGGDDNGFVYNAANGRNSSGCAQLSYSSTAHDDWLILPQITAVAGMKATWWHKNQSATTYAEDYDVKLSTTNTEAASFTTEIAADVTPSGEYTQYEVDLTAYAGQQVYIGIHSTTTDMFRIYFDDFAVITPDAHDLTVTSINTPAFFEIPEEASATEAFTPEVTVANIGSNEESSYNVKVTAKKVGEDALAYDQTVPVTTAITALTGTNTVSFPAFTPTAGQYIFKAIVELTGDANTNNDTLTVDTLTAKNMHWAYANVMAHSAGTVNRGIIKFDSETPSFYQQISIDTAAALGSIYAGDCVDSVWYAFRKVGTGDATAYSLITINYATGARTEVGSVDSLMADMAYDYSSGTMYSTGVNKLYTLNLTTGAQTLVAEFTKDGAAFNLLTLACNLSGQLYGIGFDANLYTVDKTTAAVTLVGATSATVSARFQSIAFDHTDSDKLYWAQFYYQAGVGGNSKLYTLNTTTGAATPKIGMPGAALVEMTGLNFPYKQVKYTATFNVTDGTDPVADASINVWGQDLTTDAAGAATIELPIGDHAYTVVKAGFTNATGTLTIADAAVTENVTLVAGATEWAVTFTVKDETNALIEGATVTLDGATAVTNATGVATINHVDAADLAFTVTKDTYDTFNGTVTIAGAATTANATLVFTKHDLTFTVKQNWASNAAIEGATVTIVSGDSTHTATTNATGEATLHVAPKTYTYTVSKANYVNATGSVELTADATQDVMLDELKTTPFALAIDIASDVPTNATLSWNNPTGFADDFEGHEDFAIEFSPWILKDVDGLATYGFGGGTTFPHSAEPMAAIVFNPSAVTPAITTSLAHSGDKYLATFNPSSGTKTCNDWIIAPKTLIADNDSVSFWARGGNASYSQEKFQVFVSTTDTATASFANITEVVTCPANSTTWVRYAYSLNDYAGQEVYVALHITSVDQFYFCMDDFKIGNPPADAPVQAQTRNLQSFTISLDGAEVATGITETSYDFTGLSVGDHVAGVKAIYESGATEEATINFTITGVNTYTTTFTVKDNSNNPLTGANININGTDLTTDASGVATIDLENGDYNYTVSLTDYNNATGTVTVAGAEQDVPVMLDPTSISELFSDMTIAPNPTKNFLNIKANHAYKVEVLDITGRVLSTFMMNGNSETIDMSSYKTGMYLVRLSKDKQSMNYKVIKQ